MAQASRKAEFRLASTMLRQVRHTLRESVFLVLVACSGFLLIALLTYSPHDSAWSSIGSNTEVTNYGGVIGAWFADVALYFLGLLAFLLPVGLIYAAWYLTRAEAWQALDGEVVLFRAMGTGVTLAAGCALATLLLPGIAQGSGGGVLGVAVSQKLVAAFGPAGGSLFLLALFLAGFTLTTGITWVGVLDVVGRWTWQALAWLLATPGLLWQHYQTVRAQRAAAEESTLSEPAAAQPDALASEPVTAVDPPKQTDEYDLPDPLSTVETPEYSDAMPASSPHHSRIEPTFVDDTEDETEWYDSEPERGVETNDLAAEREDTTPENDPPPVFSLPALFKSALSKSQPAPESPIVPAVAVSPQPPVKRVKPPLPPLELLDRVVSDAFGYSEDELDSMSVQLEGLLASFGVTVTVVNVEPGPVITRFEIDPAPGVKVNQISNLSKDLARGLSVTSVRVVEVIPGKSVIGLEIPNQRRQIVYLGEILASSLYQNASSPLTLVLGKDIGGRPVVANLGKMPHLLVAGTTGSGKSVAINAMLLSLLYKSTPDDVRLILIDPKMLELSVYEDIPHLLAPVVTDMKEAANALRWCVAEMERRYRLMAALKVRNIAGFNRQVRDAIAAGQPMPDPLYKPSPEMAGQPLPTLEPLPFIVVVIDELADMMMIVGKKVEELIARLAQKARASGIHLILATQRPSVDVITGLIKANIPTRIAFQVSSKVDSRTILDQMGAENLLGHGDMLFHPPGAGFTERVHGAFVEDHEVNQVVDYIKQHGQPDYIEDILEEPIEVPDNVAAFIGGGDAGNETDVLYDQAVQVVTESRKASISSVQRRLRIGYNRAARLIEEMEAAGVVGPPQHNGTREVLAPPPPEV